MCHRARQFQIPPMGGSAIYNTLDPEKLLSMCMAMNATRHDFQMVLAIEDEIYPTLNKQTGS